ncbi:ABC transporter ATP-binding protein [Euzebya tangerina]|uniref:ABC transporter ATP-binding protein n=1 Tax=Euzebya tangerina TaxID=591198 RepID=UPI000E323258|nr:ABC transporter ATP-binding protein [Euzebya tangerina]
MSQRTPAIRVTDLHEVFKIYDEVPPGIKERLTSFRRSSFREFHALNGVTLDIMPGERVGLIGHNGSGKSTLLKCMAGILPADQGSVETNGRVATLLELGAGFSPELTGRENMFLNGSILGLSRAEVEASFDDIVDFAGIRDFIDNPVKNYSSGMYVRLGFAIAVHVDPDILLVDEVLAVGDQTFQERSLARMTAFAEAGKTVVLVSHDLESINNLCDRGILLESGRVVFDGPVSQALEEYQRRLASGHGAEMRLPELSAHESVEEDEDTVTGAVTITDVGVTFPDLPASETPSGPSEAVDTGTAARLTVTAQPTRQLIGDGGLYVRIVLRRPDLAMPLYDSRTSYRVQYVAPPPPDTPFTTTVDLRLNVLSGTYLVDVEIGNAETDEVHDQALEAARVVVRGEPWDVGVVPVEATFTVDNPAGVWPPESEPPAPEDGGPAAHPDPLWPRGAEPPTATR